MSKLALMFPGQGSQAVGMGCDLCAAYSQVRDTYAEASDALDFDLEQVCALGPAEKLARTDITQPALLTNSVGVLRVLVDEGLKFDAAFGHSLGEYSALVATGAISFAEGLRLVRTRGRAMLAAADAEAGGMAAVIGLPDQGVEKLCAGVQGVWPANFNSPGQVVVSGRKAALDDLAAKATEAGAKRVLPLAVSGAFHSPLMAPAQVPLRAELEQTSWSVPAPPFFSACSLEFESGGFVDLLTDQLVSPVRFTEAVSKLHAAGYDAFLEVGPGSVLSGLVKRIAPEASVARAADADTIGALRDDSRYWEVA
jgi:[acyl-carrier-protein] S-malonyltransferase